MPQLVLRTGFFLFEVGTPENEAPRWCRSIDAGGCGQADPGARNK